MKLGTAQEELMVYIVAYSACEKESATSKRPAKPLNRSHSPSSGSSRK